MLLPRLILILSSPGRPGRRSSADRGQRCGPPVPPPKHQPPEEDAGPGGSPVSPDTTRGAALVVPRDPTAVKGANARLWPIAEQPGSTSLSGGADSAGPAKRADAPLRLWRIGTWRGATPRRRAAAGIRSMGRSRYSISEMSI